jgi:hypothetical protein
MSKSLVGEMNPFFGRKHSEESKRKMSETRKRLGIKNDWNKGMKFPQMTGVNNPACKPEVRSKIAESKRGEKNPNWKGGISDENALIRHSSQYKQWRQAVFARDGHTCQDCEAKNGDGVNVYLNADHIKPFAYHPELRFELSNGRTLCLDCHKKTETYGFHK